MTLKILDGIWNVGSKAAKSIAKEASLPESEELQKRFLGRRQREVQDFQSLFIHEGRAIGGEEVTYILHLGQALLRLTGVDRR